MNIGIVVRTLKIGGMERAAANLTDTFMDEGHHVTLKYLKNRPIEIRPERNDADIRLLNLDRSLAISGIGFIWMVISRVLNMAFRKSLFVWQGLANSFIFRRKMKIIESEKGRFHFVIIRGQGTFEQLWACRDPRLILVCENIYTHKHKGLLASWYGRLLFNGKKVVCVSEGVLKSFGDYAECHGITPESLTVISNPVNSETIKARREEGLTAIAEEPYILGLGRLVPQKNFARLIRAYKILVDTYDFKYPLVIVGDGKERDSLIELVNQLGLGNRVSFPGATNNPYA